MLSLFVKVLMSIRCCCEQEAAAYRTVPYQNHYSEAPDENGREVWVLNIFQVRGYTFES